MKERLVSVTAEEEVRMMDKDNYYHYSSTAPDLTCLYVLSIVSQIGHEMSVYGACKCENKCRFSTHCCNSVSVNCSDFYIETTDRNIG